MESILNHAGTFMAVFIGFLIVVVVGATLWFVMAQILSVLAAKRHSKQDKLMLDFRGRQLYVHQSHILMAGYGSATECINCGGNSLSTEALEKLLVNCSMELSVYNGNNKFKTNTGETHV